MHDNETTQTPLVNELQRGRSFPTWRTFVKAGALFATLTGLLLLNTGCGGEEYETVEVIDTLTSEVPTKGIITTIKEVKPNQFAIADEEIVEDTAATKVIVKYLDGRTENLTLAQARARVAPQDSAAMRDTALHVVDSASTDTSKSTTPKITKTTKSGNVTTHTTDNGNTIVVVDNTQPQYHSGYSPGMHTLGYVLMGSALGYYMGKSMSVAPNPNVYQNPRQTYYNTRRDSARYGSSSSSRYSSSGGARASTYSALRSTARTTTSYRTSYKSVPSGRSGYFGGRSSSGRSGGSYSS